MSSLTLNECEDIDSSLTRSSGESLCASTSQIPQLIQQYYLRTSDIAKSPQLSLHHLLELDLSKNQIRKIHGLEALSFLRRLNLSFNLIAQIEGLQSLQHLLWLSLYHNEISDAQGLDNCIALQTLSLGENRIESIQDNVVPYMKHLQHLRDLNLKGNPCIVENQNANFELVNRLSHDQTIRDYFPSLVHFNDEKISKASIDDDHFIFMAHNKSHYNVLNALKESGSNSSLHFQLNLIHHMSKKSITEDMKIFWNNPIDSIRKSIKAMWTEYVSQVFEQEMKIIQYISTYEKYLWDTEQHQLHWLSDRSENSVDNLIEVELSYGENIQMKWIEASNMIDIILSNLTRMQNTFYESFCNIQKWNTDEQNFLNNQIINLFQDSDIRRRNLVKAAQDLSENWYCRHRNRIIEISRIN